jgi:hypothetical protein
MEGSLVAYKVFTNGSVLPASDINTNLMNQSVMVFADSATRAAALTAPLEGMLTWLEDLNRYENYNGTAWVYLGNTGLELIKTQTIGTAVGTVPVTGVFSATYDAYQILVSGGVASGTIALRLKLRAAATGHNTMMYYNTWGSTSSPVTAGGTNLAFFSTLGSGNTAELYMNAQLINPFAATKTQLISATEITTGGSSVVTGIHTANTSFTDFTISTVSGTLTGGTIAVYGYRKA